MKTQTNMMDQFVVVYIPGGMTLNRSGMWLCLKDKDGDVVCHLKQLTFM